MTLRLKTLFTSAPSLTGALFFVLAFASCEKKEARTPGWQSYPSEVATTASSESDPVISETASGEPATDESTPAPADDGAEPSVRFMAYNVYNFLTMRRGQEMAPKPEREIDALVKVIVSEKPDILGVCEIGSAEDLASFQSHLREAGLDLPNSEHTGGADGTRHLGLLSRFPIVATDSQSDLTYELNGQTWGIQRGILDATIDTGEHRLRFLGCHLKSKREIEEADQELLRENEAILLREHASAILEADPETLLIAYGDFNDTIKSKPVSIAKGHHSAHNFLADYYFKDSRGELWTHFWDYQDVYSRFDYVLYSRSLTNLLDGKNSHIVDHPDWRAASDHRALVLSIK